MRLTFAILICCLYALSAVDANTFSKSGSTDVQHGNAKPAKPLNLWSDDKSDDGDKDGKWSKDGKDDKDNKDDNDECASRSVAVLIGTSTYAIPCLQGGSIINLNGLIPTPIVTSSIASSSTTEASSSAVSSSALNVVESSSSAASSSAPPSSSAATSSEESSATYSTTTTDTNTTTTDTTTTTTDTTTTTTDTTTTTTTDITGPIAIVTLYDALDCTGNVTFVSSGTGCFNHAITQFTFSATGTSGGPNHLFVDFYSDLSCGGNFLAEADIFSPYGCDQSIDTGDTQALSYFVYI